MAIITGFFNSINGDRKYNAEKMSNYFEGMFTRGVLQNFAGKFLVLSKSNMSVEVSTGKAYFTEGIFIKNTATHVINIHPSDVTLNRIDRIVLRKDKNESVRNANIVYKKGTPASSPVAPVLINDDYIEEMSLATIYVGKLVEVITQASITNTIPDPKVCGYVTGLIDQVDTHDLYMQYEKAYQEFYEKSEIEFDEWFDTLKEKLSTSTLLRQYTNSTKTTIQNQKIVEIGIATYEPALDILNVYVNNMWLIEGKDYTKTAIAVTLTLPLDINQNVYFSVFKSIDGEKAITVIEQVEALNDIVYTNEKYIYRATGVDDNIKLSQLVQDFNNGTGQFAGVSEYAQAKFEVIGTLGIGAPYSGDGTTENPYVYFLLNKNSSYKSIIVDFGKADRIIIEANKSAYVIAGHNTIIKNIQITATAPTTGDFLYSFRGENMTVANAIVDLTAQGLATGISGTGEFENVYLVVKSVTGSSRAIVVGNGVTRVINSRLYALRKTALTSTNAIAIYVAGASANAILFASNNRCDLTSYTGYKQDTAIHVMAGKYVIVGNAVFNAVVKAGGTTGQETATLLL